MKEDHWQRRAREEGYRARSAYKLKQIQDRFGVIGANDDVLDLGAAPGGWLQVAREITRGRVVGVDLRPVSPIEGVESIRGDFTGEGFLEEVGEFDVVLCDASPDLSGNWDIDHARSVELARGALSLAREVLTQRGKFVCKVFQGEYFEDFLDSTREEFVRVRSYSPEASRKRSAEMYVVAEGRKTAPVSEGDLLRVEIVDLGREGDGVARLDDFVVFVPETDVGEEVEVEVVDVRERFGFAEKRG